MGEQKTKIKNLKRILEEDLGSNQRVAGISLLHWHHGKPMISIDNQGPFNDSRFYVCQDCDAQEIPYLARLLKFNEENFYSNFSCMANQAS